MPLKGKTREELQLSEDRWQGLSPVCALSLSTFHHSRFLVFPDLLLGPVWGLKNDPHWNILTAIGETIE